MECDLIGRSILHAGIDEGRHAIHDDRRAAETALTVGAAWSGRERLMAPMHHVGADRMAPVHVSPDSSARVELVEEVIFPLPPEGTVGIIHPVVWRKQVVFRSQWVVCQ